jgi:hypothetical protein
MRAAQQLKASLKEGLQLAVKLVREAREAILRAAEDGITSCGELEAHGELELAVKQVQIALDAYTLVWLFSFIMFEL